MEEAIAALPAAAYTAADGLAPIQEEVRRLVPQAPRRDPSLIDR